MIWGMQCGCKAGVGVTVAASCISRGVMVRRGVYGVRCGQQSVVNVDRRIELFDQLKLKLACKEAWILRSNVRPGNNIMKDRLCTSAVASQALQDKSSAIFGDVCVNPKVLSPEAGEFMLSVAASQTVLSLDESQDAGHVDVVLQGVHPITFGPVLLVCTTTMFAAAIEKSDVEKALWRSELWQRAVGPSFSVLPVVAGYELPPEVADFSKDLGVRSFDISK